MARSTTRSLAGRAAQAARKVVAKRSSTASSTASSTGASTTSARAAANGTVTPPKKAAKKAPAAKAPAKKAPVAKKAPAKKAAAAKAPAKKAAAKKGPAAKKAPAKKVPAKKAAKKAPPTKVAAKKAVAKKAPATQAVAPAPAKKTARTSASKRSASPASLAVLPGEKPWTKAEVDEVLADLHSDRARALRTLSTQEEDLAGLMRDAGDGAGHDQADMGATSFERDQELTVLNNEREKLAQIDRALARIADGTYGTCESCGNPIGKGRAMAFPRATLCLTCKQREERR